MTEQKFRNEYKGKHLISQEFFHKLYKDIQKRIQNWNNILSSHRILYPDRSWALKAIYIVLKLKKSVNFLLSLPKPYSSFRNGAVSSGRETLIKIPDPISNPAGVVNLGVIWRCQW